MKAPVHALTLSLCVLAQAVGAQPLTLRTTAQEGSAPKFIESASSPISGHCPDILAALTKVDRGLHIDISPVPTPIKRIEGDLKEGRIDIVCALLATPLRSEIAHRISTPLFHVQERLVGRRDDAAGALSLNDLAQVGAPVVTQSGASYAADLRQRGVNVIETTGGSAIALRAVASKRARFYYTNELTGAYYIRTESLGEQLHLHPGVLQSSPSYLWASRRLDAPTLQRLEQAVAQLKRSGELDRIYQRYQRLQ